MKESDRFYSANKLIGLLHVSKFVPQKISETLPTATPILENILNYAVEEKIIGDTFNERDLLDTRIMNCVMLRTGETIYNFKIDYNQSLKLATENYYKLSIASGTTKKILLVQENNLRWTLPGGLCDVDQSPAENTIKEVFEEVSLKISVDKIVAIHDRNKRNALTYIFGVTKFFSCVRNLAAKFKKISKPLRQNFLQKMKFQITWLKKNAPPNRLNFVLLLIVQKFGKLFLTE